MTRQEPTSKQGYHVRCDASGCYNLVWYDTTHGCYPGPVFCSDRCYEAWCDCQPVNCTPPF